MNRFGKKVAGISAMLVCGSIFGQPVFHFEANEEKKLPEKVEIVKQYAPDGISWSAASVPGKFAIDIDGMPKKGAPLRFSSPELIKLCTNGFTVEMRIFPRLRRNNPNFGGPGNNITNEVILSMGSAWHGKGFFIKIFQNDLGFGIYKQQWHSWFVNYNISKLKDQWLDMAFVYAPESGYLAVYIDSKRCALKKIDGRGHECSLPLLIGGESTDWTFDGLIDKITITPRVKTPEELSNVNMAVEAGAKKLNEL